MSNLNAGVTVNHARLAQYLDFVIQHPDLHLVPIIAGAPGGGKSHAVEQACGRNCVPCMIMHPVMSTPEDFKGYPGPC